MKQTEVARDSLTKAKGIYALQAFLKSEPMGIPWTCGGLGFRVV